MDHPSDPSCYFLHGIGRPLPAKVFRLVVLEQRRPRLSRGQDCRQEKKKAPGKNRQETGKAPQLQTPDQGAVFATSGTTATATGCEFRLIPKDQKNSVTLEGLTLTVAVQRRLEIE